MAIANFVLQTNFRQLVFLDYEKRKSIVCKVHGIHLLKIPLFYLCYGFIYEFECSDDSYKNTPSKNVRNLSHQINVISKF